MTYFVLLHEEAQERLMKLDNSIRSILIKRMSRMRDEPAGRHLKQGLDYFVIDVGQHRIVYTCDEADLQKIIYFVGDHKEYEKWYQQQMQS